MAAAKPDSISVTTLLKDAFQLTIECGICTETKELRQLPCQHTICYDCLDRVISRARAKRGHPECSYCKLKLTGEAADYPVCRLVANLRTELEQFEKALAATSTNAEKSLLCESEDCQRHIDLYCKICQLCVCYSCSKVNCKDHSGGFVDFDGLRKTSKEKYNAWKAKKKEEISQTRNKLDQLIGQIKEEAFKVTSTNIPEFIEFLLSLNEEVQVANKAVAEETRIYNKYESDISGVSDVEFIRLVGQLSVAGGQGVTRGFGPNGAAGGYERYSGSGATGGYNPYDAVRGQGTIGTQGKTGNNGPKDDECLICMDKLNKPVTLPCSHKFCKNCMDQMKSVSKSNLCPVCRVPYSIAEGKQPKNGQMTEQRLPSSLPGHAHCGTIMIHYNIPSGTQGPEHPHPGQSYHGTTRTAFLPDNTKGKLVHRLLKKAFQQRLIFAVDRSVTTGRDNCVVWNDIHHKTSQTGGPSAYGYPDADYFDRVIDDLKAKGITE